MKFGELRVYCLELALTDFGCDLRRSESARPRGSFFCQVNNARLCRFPVSQISWNLHIAHKTWFCEVVNPFRIIFWKLPLRGLFFQKYRDHRQRFPTSNRDFSEMITNLGKSWQVGAPMECRLSIRTVGINSESFPWTAESVHRMTVIDASLPNGHAASECSLDVTLHYWVIRGAAAPSGRCVIAQLRVN